MVFKHCLGQLNKKANILSRQKYYQEGVEDDNSSLMVLKWEFLWEMKMEVGDPSDELMKKIRKSKNVEEK